MTRVAGEDAVDRRKLLKRTLWGAAALIARPAVSRDSASGDARAQLAALERQFGGRLGVSMLDTQSGVRAAHRGDERVLMCSTMKVMAVAAVLACVDQGAQRLDRRIVFGTDAVLAYAPITSRRVGAPGMSVAELCHAAITVSDNTAANLLVGSLGGPGALTEFVRSFGDSVTRFDRTEPDLNVTSDGDTRDTTTPNAMLASLHKVLLGHVLSPASRARLIQLMLACETGAQRLRAGVPEGWRVGDKTGSGAQGEANDVAILWPPTRKPLLVTAYYAGSSQPAKVRNRVLADVGRVAALS